MAQEALVESQIADASALVRTLDACGDSPTFAVWYLYDDGGEWRLLLAGSAFDKLLPNQEPAAYRKIAEALAKTAISSLAISDVKLVATDSPLPKTVRFLVRTPANALMRAHFSSNYINGVFIKEMIVLRSA
jgi:hypothetical protein